MKTYHVEYPRGFANEYHVYVVTPETAQRFSGVFPNARRIDRKEAVELGWTRPRRAKKTGEQWYGGFVIHDGADSLAAAIADAARATAWEIREREEHAAMYA